MADLSQTPANVHPGSDCNPLLVQWGEDGIQPGMPVYKSSSKYYKGDCDDASKYDVSAIALTYGDEDEYGVIQETGDINIGATTVQGEPYFLSDTAGGIKPAADLGAGDYCVYLGTAKDTAGTLTLGIKAVNAARS
jgi:hypothetical protein